MERSTKVKRNFELSIELWGKPDTQEILEAIQLLRFDAVTEFGRHGYTERADVIGPNQGSGPDAFPCLIFRAFPIKGETK